MCRLSCFTLVAFLAWQGSLADAQAPLPPRWDDLPKRVATWPDEWAKVVDNVPAENFEKEVMKRIAGLLSDTAPEVEALRRAEFVLAAALRRHLSERRPAPLAPNPKLSLQIELENHLAKVRAQLIAAGDDARAEEWLTASAQENELGKAVLPLWLAQAKAELAKPDHVSARKSLERIDVHFVDPVEADEIRKALHDQACALLKDAPGQTLIVAVRALPEFLSPATAWTEAERQSLGLIFDRLYDVEHDPTLGKRYRPRLAAALPLGTLTAVIPLRRDVYFSNGERLTVADIRASAQLTDHADATGRSALWRIYLDVPEVKKNRFQLDLTYQQGLFDPRAPLTFWVLPRLKTLQRPDDAAFARAPVGSGPFHYAGIKEEAGQKYAHFQANPHDLRRGAITEIRMTVWTDAKKDLGKPLPNVILDAATDQLAALRELGYEPRSLKTSGRVYFLAVNQRRAALASVHVRQAISHALDRETLLTNHFRSKDVKVKHHATSNGLFPRESWANALAGSVPAELFDAVKASSSARSAKNDVTKLALTLKYPAGEPRLKACCEEMAGAIAKVFQEAWTKADVHAQGLPSADLRKALEERDYDLLYMSEEGLDDPVRLALCFDRAESATRKGGSNYLGHDGDTKLQDLLRAATRYREFSAVQRNMQQIHVQLTQTAPAIPLWQLDLHVLVQPGLQTPTLDPDAVFSKIREWKVK